MVRDDLTKKELLEIAKKINLMGRSKMNKEELYDALFPKKRTSAKRKNPRLSPFSPLQKNEVEYAITNEKIEELGRELDLTFKYKTKNSRINQITNELADRMCKCIKAIQEKTPRLDEQRAIAICRSSVLKKRGVDLYTFKCKDEKGNYSPRISPKKGTKMTLKLI